MCPLYVLINDQSSEWMCMLQRVSMQCRLLCDILQLLVALYRCVLWSASVQLRFILYTAMLQLSMLVQYTLQMIL